MKHRVGLAGVAVSAQQEHHSRINRIYNVRGLDWEAGCLNRGLISAAHGCRLHYSTGLLFTIGSQQWYLKGPGQSSSNFLASE